MLLPDDVLTFWFSDHAHQRWFARDAAFDDELRARFGASVEAAGRGALDAWRSEPRGALALVILLDQLSRNLYRGTANAFAHDAQAREIADRAIAAGFDRAVPLGQRAFFYLPFEHSERLADQVRSLALFTQLVADHAAAHPQGGRDEAEHQLVYAQRHHDVVARFGRFPHRNAALGRASTEAELAFLREPGSSF